MNAQSIDALHRKLSRCIAPFSPVYHLACVCKLVRRNRNRNLARLSEFDNDSSRSPECICCVISASLNDPHLPIWLTPRATSNTRRTFTSLVVLTFYDALRSCTFLYEYYTNLCRGPLKLIAKTRFRILSDKQALLP